MRSLFEDIRFGLRMLARNRSLTLIGTVTLALGVGVNTAIFSAVAAYFWTPLPYPEPDRLVTVSGSNVKMGWDGASISYPDGLDWRKARSIESLSIYRSSSLALSGTGEPQTVQAVQSTPELFDVLGVHAAVGRTFGGAELGAGEHRVAVIADGLWRRQFAADPGLPGKDVRLDGKNYQIIGILPPAFHFFHSKSEVFIPLYLPPDRASERGSRFLRAIARLAPGAGVEQASSEIQAISQQLERDYPDSNLGWSGSVRSALETVIPRGARISITTLYYAVTLVLLIACVNIASLLLSRGALRQKELAIRASLGAGRGRILSLLLTESTLLGLAGGALGVAFAYWAIPVLRTIAPQDMAQSSLIALDARGLLYALAICLISGLLAGLAPALAMSRGHLAGALHSGGRGNTSSRHGTLRALVVVEVVLSVVLLAGGGLLVKSLVKRLSADPGFDRTRLMTASVSLPPALYPEKRQAAEFFRVVLEQLNGSPGIASAAAAQTVPLGGSNSWSPVIVEGAAGQSGQQNMVGHMVVTPEYFDTLGVPIIAGRAFAPSDADSAQRVAIVNQTLAKRYWPDDPAPLGRRLKAGNAKSDWLTVVGVARDVRHSSTTSPARPEIYLPHAQNGSNGMVLLVRTHSDPHQAARLIRSAVWAADRNQPLNNVESMDEMIDRRSSGPRATAQVMGFLAFLALVLASVGIYGVVSYMASQRSREIGIRLALGAERRSVFAMVLRAGLAMAGLGLAIGCAAAAGVTPLLRRIIEGVEPHDAATFAGTAAILLFVAVAATFAPAVRAMRLDPIRVLREE